MDNQKIGKAIAFLRKQKGMTQQQLADILKISDKAVSKWERGLSCPDVSILNQLAVILESDVSSLLDGKIGPNRSGWKGILYLQGLPASTKIGDATLLSIQLSYFVLAGITEIAVVCDDGDMSFAAQMRESLKKKGVKLQLFVGRDCLPEEFVGGASVMVIYEPLFLYGVNVTRKFRWAMAKPNGITGLVAYDPKGADEPILFDLDHRLSVRDDADVVTTLTECSYLPILFFKSGTFLPHSKMLRHEISPDFVELLGRGIVKIKLFEPDQAADAEAFMRIMERQMGVRVYDLDDIIVNRVTVR